MGKTSYYSMDGMIFAESTNGVMRNYGTDALGSVVETIVNVAVENTYQYKPYGGLLAKTGTAPDPSFLWNGGSGYRATRLPNSDSYVRRHHFSSISAQWTTTDLSWPIEPPFAYAGSSPTTRTDPWGPLSVQQAPPYPYCTPRYEVTVGQYQGYPNVYWNSAKSQWMLQLYLPIHYSCICACPSGSHFCKGFPIIKQMKNKRVCDAGISYPDVGVDFTTEPFPRGSDVPNGDCPAQWGTLQGCRGGNYQLYFDAPGISDGGGGRSCWQNPPWAVALPSLDLLPLEVNAQYTSRCWCSGNPDVYEEETVQLQVSCWLPNRGTKPVCAHGATTGVMKWQCANMGL